MRLFGLIGKSLAHSFSQSYFTDKFRSERVLDCQYQNFELADIQELPQLIKTHANLHGLNVTIPFKQEVLALLDEQNAAVKNIGACNCIKIENGKLIGFNTDVTGFKKSLQPLLETHHTKALILGSGGASKAVQYALKELGIEFLIVSRTASGVAISYQDLTEQLLEDHTLIINTTPAGMYPNIEANPQLPYHYIGSKHFLYDLIYNPAKTKFLIEGERRGARICNGYQMLQLQAIESWNIWNDRSRAK